MKRLPVGEQSFENLRKQDFIYVDKTAYILQMLTTGGNYNFLSRPRRFGKSLFLSTIKAVFEGKKELFEGLYIYDKIDWEEKHPVLLLDMSTNVKAPNPDQIYQRLCLQLNAIVSTYDLSIPYTEPSALFMELIRLLHAKTGKQVIVLIDEYDKPILDAMDDLERATEIRSFLQNFYSVIKSSAAHLRFVFLTGVSKISQTSIFSGLNNLNDITMDRAYAGICGYTQQELEDRFKEHIALLAKEEEKSIPQVLTDVKRWYNGYSWDGNTFVYNPFSVLLLLSKKEFDYHWFYTGTPTFLIKLLQNKGDLSVLLQNEIMVSRGFADTQTLEQLSIVPLFFQTGYLTIKKSIPKERLYHLQIPNEEVRSALTESVLAGYTGKDKSDVNILALNIKMAFSNGNTLFAIKNLRTLFSSVSYDSHIPSEFYYHALFQLTMNLMDIDHQAEVHNDNSRTDSVLKFSNRIYVIEIKYSEDKASLPDAVKRAMQQIKDREYYQPYLHQGKEVHLLALVFTKGGMDYAEEVMR